MKIYQELLSSLNSMRVKLDEALSNHTTVRIGGPADIWYEPENTKEFIDAIIKARELGISVTILGRGSNVLISDDGIRGLVIRNGSKNIIIRDKITTTSTNNSKPIEAPRLESDSKKGSFKYSFMDLDYDESDCQKVEVFMESGVDMPYAINHLINLGITGLQWFSRIPGNLGGWIFNNVHGGTHFIEEYVKYVTVLTPLNEIIDIQKKEIDFGYDKSRFHYSKEIILSCVLELFIGDKERAKATSIEWAKRKSLQPSNSIGCVFKNISMEEKQNKGYPTNATGYIIEHELKMKGFGVGDAVISPNHHNFIENKGNATAKDYIKVIKTIKDRAKKELDLNLETEIFFLGFDKNPLQ